jgi:hypothetical protein
MARLAAFFIVVGIGSFILPLIGYQFRLISLFGDNKQLFGVIFILIGLSLVGVKIISRVRRRSNHLPANSAARSNRPGGAK